MPTDCGTLKTCVADEIASSSDYPAYVAYLEEAPLIDDPTSFIQCGR